MIGLVVADYAYFRALMLMGPRRATLIAALAPVFAAGIGWAFLGETLGGRGLLGMAVTLAGIAWVVLEQTPALVGEERTLAGSLYGAAYALGQAAARSWPRVPWTASTP